MSTSNPSWESEGPLVSSVPAAPPSMDRVLEGKHVTLIPLDESHAGELYHSVAGVQNGHLYKYMPMGPFTDLESFTTYTKLLTEKATFFSYAISPRSASGQPVSSSSAEHPGSLTGIMAFLNIVPSNRSIEIGNVLFGQMLQRTTAATEACYLLMKHCFEDLHFLRVEWKANNLNEPSKRAALRLGFVFEGIFRKHMVVKGRRRDTAWYSVTDDEWEGGVKKALERWLREDNFDEEKRQKIKLEEVRKGIITGLV